MLERGRSKEAYEKAKKIIPGGVNSPVRSFSSVDSIPVYAKNGKGSRLWDIDGNEYIDYIQSWGPLILGHASPIAKDGIMEA
ncbi:MAG: aminotransferase class III-fold pyridoxal phosphate-dependent enzyme, partial [Vallitaleaceae bacterium]|nr:aminotransferase class III-fold pyridoxal phosphate-dependent enzyme [Vallitaleaceae bacterium]